MTIFKNHLRAQAQFDLSERTHLIAYDERIIVRKVHIDRVRQVRTFGEGQQML